MTWIKDNKFLVALSGVTLVAMILLYLLGSKGASNYTQAKEEFDAAAAEASNFEGLALYPRPENRDGKSKALDEYRESITRLQAAFEPYRSGNIENVTPQDFTNQLKAVNDEVRKAFAEGGTKLPDEFFCGFGGFSVDSGQKEEFNYRTKLAKREATGILSYQLLGIKDLMLALTASGARELRNLHRPLLPEEQGAAHQPQPTDIARPLPLEITFSGPEKSVRNFLTAITKPDGRYVVIRSLRIANAKKEPPRAADAKFDKPAAKPAAPSVSDIFGADFAMPEEGEATAGEAKPAPKPAPADSSRVLAQVLGNEELVVFLRLDLMRFLPAKPLP